MREFTLATNSDVKLAVALRDIEAPTAVVQIMHGLKEHKERYYEFMEFLATLGFASIISDNRGHGASLSEDYPLGYMDGWEKIIDDQVLVTEKANELWPGTPIYVFGHSFGSMLARCYLEQHDDKIKKMILSGTVDYRSASSFGVLLGRTVTLLKGKRGKSKLLIKMGDNDDVDWVSNDPRVMEHYRADPLCCGYKYMNESIVTVWKTDRELGRVKNYRCKNPDLPILSISGKLDPCTGGTDHLEQSVNLLKKAGYKNVKYIEFPGLKHEIINCEGRGPVLEEIQRFFLS